MSDVMYVVTQIRSGGAMTVDVEEFGARSAAVAYLEDLEETHGRLEGYRANLVRGSGGVVLHAEATAPGPGGRLVTLQSRYEIVERVA